MMLPAAIPNAYRLPTIRLPRASLDRVADQFAPAVLEFVALTAFLAMCIGLMAEFS